MAEISDPQAGEKRAANTSTGTAGNDGTGETKKARQGQNADQSTSAPKSGTGFHYRKPRGKLSKRGGRGSGAVQDRRQRHGGTRADANGRARSVEATDAGAEGGEDDTEGGHRLPKRKVAIHFGYCGIGYSGLQINHDVKTIEGDIFNAFCELQAISKDNAVNPNKVGLQRAARTDRGVHAAGNLLTMKLILEPPEVGPGKLVEAVNKRLPDLIRIWGFTRVQNSFNARTSCESRQYEYLLPTYVFLPPKPGSHMWHTMDKWRAKGLAADEMKTTGDAAASSSDGYRPDLDYLLDHPFWRAQGTDRNFQEDTAAKKRWRLSQKQLERVRQVLAQYEGSHNYHNFTVGKPFRDRSAHRHMIKLSISDPKIINDGEWVSIKFHGQSFMLHQIRKMIGLLVLIGRSSAPASLVPETFGPARIHVPKAPGLGLLLEEPIFTGYNRRLEETMKRQQEGPESSNKGDGGVLKEAVEFERYSDKMEHFKQTWIYDRIHQEEEEKHEYVKFLQYLDVLAGPDFEYLNPKGVIPQEAILRVGEQVRPQYRKSDDPNAADAPSGLPGAAVGDADGVDGDGRQAADEAAQHSAQESDDDEEMLKGNHAEFEG